VAGEPLLMEMVVTKQRFARVFGPAVALGVGVLLTCSVGATAATRPGLLSLDGISGARPGIAVRQLEALWGVRLRIEDSSASPGCRTGAVRADGIVGGAMFEANHRTAAWFTSGVRTPRGIQIGSTLADLKRAYGQLLLREHSLYVPGAWIYFVQRRRAPHWRLRFDVSPSDHVKTIWFGATPDVRAQEGCA
jgi:hypothetical protein